MSAITITIIVLTIIWAIGTIARFVWTYGDYVMYRDLLKENYPSPTSSTPSRREWEHKKIKAAHKMRTPHMWPLDSYLSIKQTILESRKDMTIDR